ncbi:Hypothetical protein ABZS17D1_02801 [Kosakonia cowanii]
MKKSCQVYNLLFCKGEALTGCTISVAMTPRCTILSHYFGALARDCRQCCYLAHNVGDKQSLINNFVMR